MTSVVYLTASELASGIRERQFSSIDLIEAHLDQIARHNAQLNAIVTLDADRARKRAREADAALTRGESWGPLHGVPVTIKDTIATGWLRTTAGHPPLADYVPDEDAPVVSRLLGAGAVVLGKTNTPELAEGVRTENPIFGRTNNPWNLSHSPGGSAGGCAAALAAGFTPLSVGSDAGGSIRIPAHFCGVYGIKPSQHYIPITGHIPELPEAMRALRNLATIGPMARSVDDLELAFSIMAGPDGHEWEIPPLPFVPASEPSIFSLRLAWVDCWEGTWANQETRAALTAAATELADAGASVTPSAPPDFDVAHATDVGYALIMAEMAPSLPPDAGQPVPSVVDYLQLLDERNRTTRALDRFLADYDAFILPVSSGPAFLWDEPQDPNPDDSESRFGSPTVPFNLTGHPAVVVPYTRSSEGLPIGIQIVGRRWEDAKLLAVARTITGVIGSFQSPPGY